MIAIILIVLIPVLVVVISASVFSFVRAFIDRILFYKQIKQICNEQNYKIIFPRKILASFFRYSNKPDIIIETTNKNYLLRFITCKNKSLFYNFPTPEWYVSFEKIIAAPINPTGKFKHLPAFSEIYYNANIDANLVMVFTPYLPKISYLTEKNAKREIFEKTDTIGEWLVFSAKDLLNELHMIKKG